MPDFLKQYGDTVGPLGYPMTDAEARSLDALLDTLPEVDYQRVVIHKAQTGLSDGERADIAWIITEALDRQRVEIAFSEHYAFTNNQGVWRFVCRLDGQPWHRK